MFTALVSPARRVATRCRWNASTATRPSASNGSSAAAMPSTFRRGLIRPIIVSIVMLALSSASLAFGFFQPGVEFRVLVIVVQRIAARREAVARRGGAVAVRAEAFFHLLWAAVGCVPEDFGVRQDHPPQPDGIDPTITQG